MCFFEAFPHLKIGEHQGTCGDLNHKLQPNISKASPTCEKLLSSCCQAVSCVQAVAKLYCVKPIANAVLNTISNNIRNF